MICGWFHRCIQQLLSISMAEQAEGTHLSGTADSPLRRPAPSACAISCAYSASMSLSMCLESRMESCGEEQEQYASAYASARDAFSVVDTWEFLPRVFPFRLFRATGRDAQHTFCRFRGRLRS